MAERTSKTTMLGSAGYVAAGSILIVAVAGVVALVARLAMSVASHRAPTTPGQDVTAFHSVLDVVVVVILAVQVVIAVLLALPLQAFALSLQRRDGQDPAFAKVAGLTLLSSLVSFAALYPALSATKSLLETADEQATFLAGALAVLYLVHALGLAVGRRLARRG